MLTMGVWIVSEEVMDKVILSPVLARVETELLEAMVTLESVGTVLSNRTADPLLVLVTAITSIAGEVTEAYVQTHRSFTVTARHSVGCTP